MVHLLSHPSSAMYMPAVKILDAYTRAHTQELLTPENSTPSPHPFSRSANQNGQILDALFPLVAKAVARLAVPVIAPQQGGASGGSAQRGSVFRPDLLPPVVPARRGSRQGSVITDPSRVQSETVPERRRSVGQEGSSEGYRMEASRPEGSGEGGPRPEGFRQGSVLVDLGKVKFEELPSERGVGDLTVAEKAAAEKTAAEYLAKDLEVVVSGSLAIWGAVAAAQPVQERHVGAVLSLLGAVVALRSAAGAPVSMGAPANVGVGAGAAAAASLHCLLGALAHLAGQEESAGVLLELLCQDAFKTESPRGRAGRGTVFVPESGAHRSSIDVQPSDLVLPAVVEALELGRGGSQPALGQPPLRTLLSLLKQGIDEDGGSLETVQEESGTGTLQVLQMTCYLFCSKWDRVVLVAQQHTAECRRVDLDL